jgi:hypothetical protein
MGLSVDDEFFKHLGARGTTGDAIVRADGHHPTPRSGFSIESVKLRLEIFRIHRGAEAPSFIIHDVVHMQCVGLDSERFVAHVNQKRLVAAYVVNVVNEAERLQNFQAVRSTAQPESVEANGPRAGCPLNALDTLLIRGALFLRSHGELCGPGLPVSGCFVSTLTGLFASAGCRSTAAPTIWEVTLILVWLNASLSDKTER